MLKVSKRSETILGSEILAITGRRSPRWVSPNVGGALHFAEGRATTSRHRQSKKQLEEEHE
jgi:hypothetical protein